MKLAQFLRRAADRIERSAYLWRWRWQRYQWWSALPETQRWIPDRDAFLVVVGGRPGNLTVAELPGFVWQWLHHKRGFDDHAIIGWAMMHAPRYREGDLLRRHAWRYDATADSYSWEAV